MPHPAPSRLALLLLLPLLAACGSSPATRFYTLDSLPPRASVTVAAAPVLRVDQVQVPAVLDRPQLVHEYAAGQLKVDEFSHWGAPLGQLMRAILEQDLAARLPSGGLAPAAGPRPLGTIDIAVDIVSVGNTSGGMTMDVVWTSTVLPAAAQVPVVTAHTTRLTTASSAADPQGYTAGLSAMIGDLADTIVATTR